MESDATPFPITVFSDFTCPYSYLSEAIIWRFPRATLEPRFRARELYPQPAEANPRVFDSAEWSIIGALAAESEIEMRLPTFLPRTRKAHEAARFARDRGAEIEMRRVLYALYWGDGADIARIDVLTAAAAAIGLDPAELKIALDIDRHEPEVLADDLLGERLRIPGTPAIFLGTGTAARIVLGAQPVGELRRLITNAIGPGPENE